MMRGATMVVWTLLTAPPGWAREAVDTRISFAVSDNDVLHGPSESTTGSTTLPGLFPSKANRLFFDDFDTRDTGFENLTHLVLYGRRPGYFTGLETEGALVLRADVDANGDVQLRDDGSYLRVTQDVGGYELRVTAFPINADRFRLGYAYDVSWGGNEIFAGSRVAPGLRVTLASANLSVFLGAKSGLGQVAQPDGIARPDSVWGLLGGFGFAIAQELRMEAGGGYFYRGNLNEPEIVASAANEARRPLWQGFGGSTRLAYNVGIPIGQSIDFRLYKNDPLLRQTFFAAEEYNDGFSFLISAESSVLGQTLQDADAPTSTTIQWGTAGNVTARAKLGKTRLHLLAVYRDPTFILFNVPSLTPFVALPESVKTFPEVFVSLGIDHYFEWLHLTPGLTVGIERPAHTATPVASDNGSASASQRQRLIVRAPSDWQLLDPGDRVSWVVATKATARWDLSEILTIVAELQLSHDTNRRRLALVSTGQTIHRRLRPEILGFNLLMHARF